MRRTTTKRNVITAILATLIITVFATGAMLARGHAANKPAPTEFGGGPRMSAQGLYTVTLHGIDALKPRKMQVLQFSVIGANGQAVNEATITVDGGMPQHGHGLPTRPKVTSNLGNGWYEIQGLRFNMGGWWELKLTITTPAGTDTVTFNLSL